MSGKERQRVGIRASVTTKELSLVEASEGLGLCSRQTRRVWKRYDTRGDGGLVHRLRGKPSQRRTAPELRAKILARYAERYSDCGPTLAAEYLGKEKLVVKHEPLRRWLLAENKRTVRRRRQRHRPRQENQPAATHPWRKQMIGSGRGALARRRAERLGGGENNKQPRGHF